MLGVNFICGVCKKVVRIKNTNNRIGLPSACKACRKEGKDVVGAGGDMRIDNIEPGIVEQSYKDYEEL